MDRTEMENILWYICNKEFPSSLRFEYSNRKKIFRRKCSSFTQAKGVLYYKHPKNGLLRVVSKEEKYERIRKAHEKPNGHLGETRTWRELSTEYYWLGIAKDVAKFILQCKVCQAVHSHRKLNYFALAPTNHEMILSEGEMHSSHPTEQAQLFSTKLDQEIQKWAQQCTPSALDDNNDDEEEEEDDLQDTASALDDAELWAEQQRVAISALGEEIQNWSLQQQNSASLLETDIEQLSTAQQQSTSSLEKDLERWASRHSTPTRLGSGLHRWTTNQLHDVASSLDRDLEKWESLRCSAASNLDKWASLRQSTAVSLDKDLEKWANLQQNNFPSLDKNMEKWKRRRDRPVLSLTPEKWPSPHNVMSMSLDRDLEKWERQQRENAASLERDLEKWVGECQQSALTRESDLEKWVTLHRKKTLFLEKEIDDWVDKRRHSMSLLEKEVDQWHRRHSSVSLLERGAKKNQGHQFRSYPDRPGGGALPRRDWKRVMRRRAFKETSV